MAYNPNDFGKMRTLESCRKISVNDLVRQAKEQVKSLYLQSVTTETCPRIDLVTSSTRYGGKRYWFKCPGCGRRVGVLYQDNNRIRCRFCMGLAYHKSRYHKMVEDVL